MRYILVSVLLATVLPGCAGNLTTPEIPDSGDLPIVSYVQADWRYDSPHRLWGEWSFYISEDRSGVDVVPIREARFHLNALKFLEEQCSNCLEITDIQNNGDSTIDLTLEITHPWPGLPEYTGFDVKGIIMFNGSHEIPDNLEKLPLWPENYRLSWRLMGDPELLNADGYTYHWSPWHDSGSELPIMNYWPGKYSSGTPTANVNGFLNFYSTEERHMFEVGETVSRTYHIWLPPGPVVAGYAIEACWQPPIIMPVTNPIDDFPITANQPEAYHFKYVINDGNPITDTNCCNYNAPKSVYQGRSEIEMWYVLPDAFNLSWVGAWDEEIDLQKVGFQSTDCDAPPEHPNWRCTVSHHMSAHPNGTYQLFSYEYHAKAFDPYKVLYPAFTVFEIVIDID